MYYKEFPEGLEIPVVGDPNFVAQYAVLITDENKSEWNNLTELKEPKEFPDVETEFDDTKVYWKIQKSQLRKDILDWMSKNLLEDSSKTEVVLCTPLSNTIYVYFRRKSSATMFTLMFAESMHKDERTWTSNGIRA